jgi:predicted nuclease of predicted toxin-antitoxin system
MKFLVDAQLPFRLKKWLIEQEHDAIHTDDFPDKHLTSDSDIIIAEREDRIFILEDSDFYQHNLVRGAP